MQTGGREGEREGVRERGSERGWVGVREGAWERAREKMVWGIGRFLSISVLFSLIQYL